MDYVVGDLINLALRSIGVKALNDSLKANASHEALQILNAIRAGRSIQPIKNWHLFDKTFSPTVNSRSITMGTATSNITSRPSTVDEIIIINGDVNGSNNNWNIPIQPYQEYRKIMVQNVFALPTQAFLDNEFPEQSIWFYPGLVPGYSVRVLGKAYFTDYENISDEWADPPETFEIQRLALALRLAPLYGVTDVADLIKQYQSEDKVYKDMLFNRSIAPMTNPFSGNHGAGFNFYSGLNR